MARAQIAMNELGLVPPLGANPGGAQLFRIVARVVAERVDVGTHDKGRRQADEGRRGERRKIGVAINALRSPPVRAAA